MALDISPTLYINDTNGHDIRSHNTKRDKCLLQIVEVRKKEEGRRKKDKILKKR